MFLNTLKVESNDANRGFTIRKTQDYPLCEARPRAGRSIGSGLQDVGVNPNAYLRQVVGEAINKHLSQYRIEQGLIQAVNAQMAKIFEMMAEQEGKQDDQ